MNKKLSVLFSACCFMLFIMFSPSSQAAPVYTEVGKATNPSAPSEWQGFSFDITSLISGASSALLSFDLRNDAPPRKPDPTTSQVWFGIENSNYFVHLNYFSGRDTSHWRNVQLLVDGKLYVDQFGAYNNHLGDADYGTAWQGAWGVENIAGMTGKDASTFILNPAVISQVPVPAAVWLFGSALIGLIGSRKRPAGLVTA